MRNTKAHCEGSISDLFTIIRLAFAFVVVTACASSMCSNLQAVTGIDMLFTAGCPQVVVGFAFRFGSYSLLLLLCRELCPLVVRLRIR